jgi:hypothetical protein
MPIYPITFSIPDIKIVSEIQKKDKLLSSPIPGNVSTYIYNDEESYYNEYRRSFFATTTKKVGWDCMRHYEIMANGCIPYFPDLDKCPPNTMALLPKSLLQKGNQLYAKMKNHKDGSSNLIEYESLANSILDYTRAHLTTKEMARYILEKSNHTHVKRVLYLSGDTGPDYLRCLTLHGFKELFGTSCHDYPKIPHIYKGNIDYKKLYGKGMTYTNLLDSDLHYEAYDTTLQNDIAMKHYDAIVYGNYHRGMPFYDIISRVYSPSQIILLCGEDIHNCNFMKFQQHHVFVRELVYPLEEKRLLRPKDIRPISGMIQTNYKRVCEAKGDIHEHLPTLRKYASECSSVAEMGVRSVVSTWAFLQGLLDTEKPASLLCLDINDVPEIPDIARMVAHYDISMSFVRGDSATTKIEPVDLLFIDTWHIYGHLKRELAFHCNSVKKYIILHDTTLDGEVGESIRAGWDTAEQAAKSGYPEAEIRMGLGPAVREFLEGHPEWRIKEVFTNNNGLTVLEKH